MRRWRRPDDVRDELDCLVQAVLEVVDLVSEALDLMAERETL